MAGEAEMGASSAEVAETGASREMPVQVAAAVGEGVEAKAAGVVEAAPVTAGASMSPTARSPSWSRSSPGTRRSVVTAPSAAQALRGRWAEPVAAAVSRGPFQGSVAVVAGAPEPAASAVREPMATALMADRAEQVGTEEMVAKAAKAATVVMAAMDREGVSISRADPSRW
jgi:hypothetical protein